MTEPPEPPEPAAGPPEPAAGPPEPAAGPPADVLDCRGQRCPMPVIALAKRLPQLPAGAVLRVLADDPAAANDIAAWCRLRGHELVGSPAPGTYHVRRR